MTARARRPRTGRAAPKPRLEDTRPPSEEPPINEQAESVAAAPGGEQPLGGPDTQPAYLPGREPRS